MGVMDNIKGMGDEAKEKGEGLVDQHGEQVGEGLDKAGAFADEKTGGTHGEQIDSGVTKAKDGLDGQDDDIS